MAKGPDHKEDIARGSYAAGVEQNSSAARHDSVRHRCDMSGYWRRIP